MTITRMKDNLERLLDERRDMTPDESRAFSNYFIGALQSYVAEDDWDRCIKTAKECLEACK